MMNTESVLLIGPMGAGKSTQARQLAARLKWPLASLDESGDSYYIQMPEISEVVTRLQQELGEEQIAEKGLAWFRELVATNVLAAIRAGELPVFRDESHFKDCLELYALERFLNDHSRGILELGAGHAIFEDSESLDRAKKLLSGYAFVFYLLPDPDFEVSVERLLANLKMQGRPETRETVSYYVGRSSYQHLSTHTVYTGRDAPAATCRQLLKIIRG